MGQVFEPEALSFLSDAYNITSKMLRIEPDTIDAEHLASCILALSTSRHDGLADFVGRVVNVFKLQEPNTIHQDLQALP